MKTWDYLYVSLFSLSLSHLAHTLPLPPSHPPPVPPQFSYHPAAQASYLLTPTTLLTEFRAIWR